MSWGKNYEEDPPVGNDQWRIQVRYRGARPPPLFLDQTEARRAEKDFFLDRPPPLLSQGLDDHPAPLSEGLDPPLTTPAYLQKVESTWDRRTL